jgi:hypothetical protein
MSNAVDEPGSAGRGSAAEWQRGVVDGGDLAARIARGHAAGCASCQAFGRSLGALHADLSRTAHTAARPLPLDREGRSEFKPRRARRPLLVAGTLAVGAAAVVIAVSTTERPAGPAPTVPPVAMIESSGEPLGEALDRSLGGARGVADRFSQALAKTPLDTELDALIQDGRRGVDALIDTTGLRPAQ